MPLASRSHDGQAPGPLVHDPNSVIHAQGYSRRCASGSASAMSVCRVSTAPAPFSRDPTLREIGASVCLPPAPA
eukprot:5419498-Pleurochrysis_carterae.AAC.1